MLIRHTSPMESPINESGGYEHNNHVRQHDAPIREHPLIDMASHETGKPARIMKGRHKCGFYYSMFPKPVYRPLIGPRQFLSPDSIRNYSVISIEW